MKNVIEIKNKYKWTSHLRFRYFEWKEKDAWRANRTTRLWYRPIEYFAHKLQDFVCWHYSCINKDKANPWAIQPYSRILFIIRNIFL